MENSLFLILLLILILITVLSQVLIIFLLTQKRKSSTPLPFPPDKWTDLEEKTSLILEDAVKKANKILTNAELKGIEFVAKQKLDTGKIVEQYEVQIQELEKKLLIQFEESLTKTEKSYRDFLETLQINLKKQEEQNQLAFNQQVNRLIENANKVMTTFVVDLNTQIKKQVDQEFLGVKKEIETYKQHRMEIINKNLIDMLEQTLEETLGKKLTLQEHSEIIYQALEQAKSDHALSK